MASSPAFKRKVLIYKECPVCFESLPLNQLPCGHHLCQSCIDKIAVESRIKCPECRSHARVPEDGFPGDSLKGKIRYKIARVLIEEYGTDNLQCAKCKEEIMFRCGNCRMFLCSNCMVNSICGKSNHQDKRHDALDLKEILACKEDELVVWVANGKNKIEELRKEISMLERNFREAESAFDRQIGRVVSSAVRSFKIDLKCVHDTVQRIVFIEANNQVLDRHRAACSVCMGTPRGLAVGFLLCPLAVGYHSPAEMQAKVNQLMVTRYGTDDLYCHRCGDELMFRCDVCDTFLCTRCMLKTNCLRAAGQSGRHKGLEIRKLLTCKEEELTRWEKSSDDQIKSLKIKKATLESKCDAECFLRRYQIGQTETAIRTMKEEMEHTDDIVHRIIFIEARICLEECSKIRSWCRSALFYMIMVRRALWRGRRQLLRAGLLVIALLLSCILYTFVKPQVQDCYQQYLRNQQETRIREEIRHQEELKRQEEIRIHEELRIQDEMRGIELFKQITFFVMVGLLLIVMCKEQRRTPLYRRVRARVRRH